MSIILNNTDVALLTSWTEIDNNNVILLPEIILNNYVQIYAKK